MGATSEAEMDVMSGADVHNLRTYADHGGREGGQMGADTNEAMGHYHFDEEVGKGIMGDDDIPEDELSPIEEVRLTVLNTDDPSMVCYTLRMWIIGFIVCTVLSFVDQFFYYRAQPLIVSALAGQIISLYLGRLMHVALPNLNILGMELNPGPFNIKEHVLITIFANAGSGFGYGNAWGIDLLTIIKTFYKFPLNFWTGMVIITCPQLLGYGWAGVMKKYVVDPASMWWPQSLVQVSLFRTLHEKEVSKGISRLKFFGLVALGSFVWYFVPGYLVGIVSCLSWVCWVWPKSVYAHQLGSGSSGLGLGALSFDWATISGFNGSPLAAPLFTILNVFCGFALYIWGFIPAVYYLNAYQARNFPLLAKQLYQENGTLYDVTQILTDGRFDDLAYQSYGEVYLPIIYIFLYFISFSTLMAIFVHVGLYHGSEIYQCLRNTNKMDIHCKLMKRYPNLPRWWFVIIFVITLALSVGICQAINSTMQIPWWGVIVVTIIAVIVTLPLTIVVATTNQLAGLSAVTQVLGGVIFPGKPIANMITNVWIYGSVAQAVAFLQDFKLGHYMKIPPRTMFSVQMTGTLYAAVINYLVAWWQLSSIKDICNINVLPLNSPWTCPYDNVVFVNTIVWGVVGPTRVVGARYTIVYYGLLFGAALVLPAYGLYRWKPKHWFIKNIHVPVFIGSLSGFPPSATINFTPWAVVGVFFQYFVFTFHKSWWARYNYVLSASLSVGIAFCAILLFFALQNNGYTIAWWGNQGDNCPLATCPTAPGIVGLPPCPVF